MNSNPQSCVICVKEFQAFFNDVQMETEKAIHSQCINEKAYSPNFPTMMLHFYANEWNDDLIMNVCIMCTHLYWMYVHHIRQIHSHDDIDCNDNIQQCMDKLFQLQTNRIICCYLIIITVTEWSVTFCTMFIKHHDHDTLPTADTEKKEDDQHLHRHHCSWNLHFAVCNEAPGLRLFSISVDDKCSPDENEIWTQSVADIVPRNFHKSLLETKNRSASKLC